MGAFGAGGFGMGSGPGMDSSAWPDGEGGTISWTMPPIKEEGISTEAAMKGGLGGFRAETDLGACFLPLLKALKWKGNPRHVAESMPHFADSMDLTAFRNSMSNLGYRSHGLRIKASDIDPRLMPCLFLPDKGPAFVVLGRDGDGAGPVMEVFRSGTGGISRVKLSDVAGTAYVFQMLDADDRAGPGVSRSWFNNTVGRFRPLLWQMLGTSFISNLLALAMPLFVMSVYDKVIGTGSIETLEFLLLGVLLALVSDLVLRSLRARMIAYVGARLDNIVANAIFERILTLAPGFTERATLGAQVARIKNFDTVREFFTGALATVALELPFIFLYLFVIFYLGGSLVFVPIAAVILFTVIGIILFGRIREAVAAAARAESRRQEFLVESVSKIQTLKFSGAQDIWRDRFRDMSAKSVMAGFDAAQLSSLAGTLSHIAVISAGLGTMAYGVLKVIDQSMTVGGLIASMILVWRVLGPLQTGFLAMTQLEQVRSAIRHIDNLMNLKPERESGTTPRIIKRFNGRVSFSRVSLRYSSEADPALVGITFEAKPGEIVAVVGPNGAGKSTLLKLLMGLYHPQAGNVRIDNIDIRQIDPIELRQSIAYVPQTCQMFFGTIAQNLRLAQPTAKDEEMRWALDQAGCLEEVEALPGGLSYRVGDGQAGRLPDSLLQRISLARAFVQRAPIMLLDEPVNGLDDAGDRAFQKVLERVREHATVFLVTHRPSHLKLVDQILLLEDGYLRLSGAQEEVRDRIPKDML